MAEEFYRVKETGMSFLRSKFVTAYRERMYPNYWDVLALLFVLAVITFLAWTAKQMATPYQAWANDAYFAGSA